MPLRVTPPLPPAGAPSGTWQRARKFSVYSGNRLLGTTDLEVQLPDGSGAAGRFHPEPVFRDCRDVFMRLRQALTRGGPSLARCLAERDALRLTLWRDAAQLDAQIEMISPWSTSKWVVHVRSRDARLRG
jgi:hypothetical protein